VIRVVHILTRTNVGGPSVIVSSLMDGLDGRVFQQALLRGEIGNDEGDYLAIHHSKMQVHDIRALGRRVAIFDDVRALFALVKKLKEIQPDIVHTHMAKAGALGRIAAVIARVPVRIHTYHGHLLHGYFGKDKTFVVVVAERILRLFTTYAVVVGEQVRQDLIKAKIVSALASCSIAPGVSDIQLWEKEKALDKLGLPRNKPVVLFVGRLTSIKRPDLFVDLAKRLASSNQSALCVFVGDGPLGEQLRDVAKEVENLCLAGWQKDLGVVYAVADVVVLCSDNEGMPLSLIEASLCAKAIVATNVGSVKEIVEDGISGVLVPPGDAVALHDAVSQLLGDAAQRKLFGESARVHALSTFSPDRSLQAHTNLYQQLVN
jgi:glycosyltransferase involved in cell wall biosynthesis